MNRDRDWTDAAPGAHGGRDDDDAPDVRDAALSAALREAAPAPPMEEVDWTALQARLAAAAEPALAARSRDAAPAGARQRRGGAAERAAGWWQPLAGWSAAGIPLAAAASVLLVIAAGALGGSGAGQLAGEPLAFRTVEEELIDGLSAGARQLFADGGSEAVLDVALFSDGEDW